MSEASKNWNLRFLLTRHRSTAVAIGEELKDEASRRTFAQAFCCSILGSIWDFKVRTKKRSWTIPTSPVGTEELDAVTRQLSADITTLLVDLDAPTIEFFIGSVYSALLPARVRSQWGVYYTPPPLVERLLGNVSFAGIDWTSASIIDPACGGGAFLAPTAVRMWRALSRKRLAPKSILDKIAAHLRGVEIDPFAGWMSQTLLELRLLDLMLAASRRLRAIVRVGDALQILERESDKFDLVLGNPPYGKVQLSHDMRDRYGRSIYGHANLYGLFTDLALRISAPDGMVAFVTPTSFLSGQYFKALRNILAAEAPPVTLDFVRQRDGVFEDVLQETVMAVFKKKARPNQTTKISAIDAGKTNGGLKVVAVTRLSLAELAERPWLLPRSTEQSDILRAATRMKHRLANYGLDVSTGQLVWNRHKDQLRASPTSKSLPLIWAESILPDGTFRFRSVRANHMPYFEIQPGQEHLVTKNECLLVQRTTAKEQQRRLICAVLPGEFISDNGGTVVENHLNIIKSSAGLLPTVPLGAVGALLRSKVVDEVFRCISGSVAVSAYELNALPLPGPEEVRELGRLLDKNRADGKEAEDYIAHLYGVQ